MDRRYFARDALEQFLRRLAGPEADSGKRSRPCAVVLVVRASPVSCPSNLSAVTLWVAKPHVSLWIRGA